MVIYQCDGTVDGILTAVFDAWKVSENTECEIAVKDEGNMVLFAEYVDVVTDTVKSGRVARGIQSRISHEAYYMVYMTCISYCEDRGTAVLEFVKRGFEIGSRVTTDLHNKWVSRVFEMTRNSNMELMHYRGFIRFNRHGAFFLAKYEPKNDIIVMMADFFADRLRQENFIIVDMNRNKAAVHKAGESYFITDIDVGMIAELKEDEDEANIRKLWETFHTAIGIDSRRNLSLQQQNMPLRFRKYM